MATPNSTGSSTVVSARVLSDLDRKWGQNIGTASGSILKQAESKKTKKNKQD